MPGAARKGPAVRGLVWLGQVMQARRGAER